MIEDPQDPQEFSQLPSKPPHGEEAEFPEGTSRLKMLTTSRESRHPEEPQTKPPAPAGANDYISELSEIRQNLVSDEVKATRSTSGLIRRITGSLRRVTGPLRSTGALRGPNKKFPSETSKPEISDAFLSNRLGGATVAEPQPIQLPETLDELRGVNSPAVETQDKAAEQAEKFVGGVEFALEDEQPLGDDQLDVPENRSISTPGLAEAAEEQNAEPDWMREIREEAARDAALAAARDAEQAGGKEKGSGSLPGRSTSEIATPRSRTGSLRDFFTGILGRSGKNANR